jgi:hypothetical protein
MVPLPADVQTPFGQTTAGEMSAGIVLSKTVAYLKKTAWAYILQYNRH